MMAKMGYELTYTSSVFHTWMDLNYFSTRILYKVNLFTVPFETFSGTDVLK